MPTDYELLRPARTLAEIGDTLLKRPLREKEELDAFYSEKYSNARGVDRISHLGVELGRSFRKAPFHGFVMGHPGVGKSTEISRLLLKSSERFRSIRISAAAELHPGEFRIHDLLWLMIVRILTETKSPVVTGFSEKLSPGLLGDVRQALSSRAVEVLGLSEKDLEGGLDLKLFAKIRATLKLSRHRTEKTIEYTFSELSDLLDVVNRVFVECNDLLHEVKGQEWILIVEDFEKLGVEAEPLRRLFIDYSLLFDELKCHLLFVIPVGLAYTEDAERMPFGRERQFMIPDISVYTRGDHRPDEQGIGALLDVVERRISPDLLAAAVARSLAIASGGNLRDLFGLLGRAGIAAEARQQKGIQRQDAMEAVREVRSSYRFKLGEDLYGGPDPIPAKIKIDRLVDVYRGNPSAQIPDKTLYVLLRQRMVLQFNGNTWFGVHPLVVDLLKETQSLEPGESGGTDF
jgi:hypothetical protein